MSETNKLPDGYTRKSVTMGANLDQDNGAIVFPAPTGPWEISAPHPNADEPRPTTREERDSIRRRVMLERHVPDDDILRLIADIDRLEQRGSKRDTERDIVTR